MAQWTWVAGLASLLLLQAPIVRAVRLAPIEGGEGGLLLDEEGDGEGAGWTCGEVEAMFSPAPRSSYLYEASAQLMTFLEANPRDDASKQKLEKFFSGRSPKYQKLAKRLKKAWNGDDTDLDVRLNKALLKSLPDIRKRGLDAYLTKQPTQLEGNAPSGRGDMLFQICFALLPPGGPIVPPLGAWRAMQTMGIATLPLTDLDETPSPDVERVMAAHNAGRLYTSFVGEVKKVVTKAKADMSATDIMKTMPWSSSYHDFFFKLGIKVRPSGDKFQFVDLHAHPDTL